MKEYAKGVAIENLLTAEMPMPHKFITQVVDCALDDGCKKATKYFSEREVVKATFHGKRDKRKRRMTIVVTIGAPNYAERAFIRKCKKAGEPFPVKKVQLVWDK